MYSLRDIKQLVHSLELSLKLGQRLREALELHLVNIYANKPSDMTVHNAILEMLCATGLSVKKHSRLKDYTHAIA